MYGTKVKYKNIQSAILILKNTLFSVIVLMHWTSSKQIYSFMKFYIKFSVSSWVMSWWKFGMKNING
jgi:hypothetical protein